MPLVIKGSSSGQVTIDVPAAAGTNTITLPAETFTVAEATTAPAFAAYNDPGVTVNHNTQTQLIPDTELFEKISEHLAEGKVVGWFNGAMEFGPRALGAR